MTAAGVSRLPLGGNRDYAVTSAVHPTHAAAVLTALATLARLVLAALLLAGLALSAALLLLAGLLPALLMLRLLAALLRIALLRVALLLLIAPRIVLLLVRHGTLSNDFHGLAPPTTAPDLDNNPRMASRFHPGMPHLCATN
jgi:hypothetical protein